MPHFRHAVPPSLAVLALLAAACAPAPPEPVPGLKAFVGATAFDGINGALIENSLLIVRDGRIEAFGPAASTTMPAGAEQVDLTGKYITPGWILGHGHLGGADGLKTGPEVYTPENLQRQLALYARYGVTTVLSLGGDGPAAVALRDEQATPDLHRARLYLAGPVIVGDTPQDAVAMVDEALNLNPDWIKIRVDDNLGATKKMSPAIYKAVIDRAHQAGKRLAAHLFYLDDAKGLLNAGADLVAHSVRDQPVDDDLIALLKQKNVCVCPTLTREVSTYVYESAPDFFSDPFFLRDADPAVLEQLKDPARQKALQNNESAQKYKVALEVAMANLKKLSDAGVTIVFGTDTGPPGRFQGYFEHMEMDLMVKSGLTPTQALRSATGAAAECLGLDELGTLESGKWADFAVFNANPTADIANTKTLASVWIAGNQAPPSGAQ